MVEVKNRVGPTLPRSPAPPLYDIIQLVTYLIMLGENKVSSNDMIQNNTIQYSQLFSLV